MAQIHDLPPNLQHLVEQAHEALSASHLRIALAMEGAQLTRAELARHLPFARSFTYDLTSGEVDLAHVQGRVLIELSRVLHVSTDFLLGKGLGLPGEMGDA